jgi:hypothetical protein
VNRMRSTSLAKAILGDLAGSRPDAHPASRVRAELGSDVQEI